MTYFTYYVTDTEDDRCDFDAVIHHSGKIFESADALADGIEADVQREINNTFEGDELEEIECPEVNAEQLLKDNCYINEDLGLRYVVVELSK